MQRLEKEGTFSNYIYGANVTLIPKPDKNIAGKKITTKSSHEYKNPNQMLSIKSNIIQSGNATWPSQVYLMISRSF